MSVQVIRPAGAGYETFHVFLLALAIVLLAGVVVLWRVESEQAPVIAAGQLDARLDLSAAEQGIHTDLLVVLDEIRLYQGLGQALPEPAQLAAEGFAPFIGDASANSRGGHTWQHLAIEAANAYFGRSAANDIAGSFLLLLQGELASVWLNSAPGLEPPRDLHEQALTDAGWKQVVSQFDAGVTRQHRH